jgi:eukaryotic-like serine/threonine-protein kinase
MKYVEGETIESIISKLAAGDPDAKSRFSLERRLKIFLGLLHALSLAHDRGIVHRDIKPANVMVGRHGEVMLMDWGIAKTVGKDDAPPPSSSLPRARATRMSTTEHGTLVGTPAYMSPEQAAGDNERVDHRSDLYSACVLFYELVTLRHYLGKHETVDTLLEAILREPFNGPRLVSMANHPQQHAVPWELLHFIAKGLRKKPEDRYQSAAEMEAELELIAEGRIHVRCTITMTKRMAREFGRLVDRHPRIGFATFVALVVLLGFGVWGVVAVFI